MGSGAQGIRAGRAFVELGADDGPLRKTLDAVSKRFSSWGSGLRDIGNKIAGLGVSAAAALSGTVLLFQSMGDEMAKAAQRTGLTVEALSALSYAADLSAASVEELEGGIRKMQKFMGDVLGGSKDAKQTLDQLGITLGQLKGRTPDEQFATFADAISDIHDPTVKTNLAMAVFGKTGTKLIPLLNEGADGIREMMREAKALGLVMSTEDATAAEELNDRMGELWATLRFTAFTIGAALAPAAQRIVVALRDGLAATKAFINDHRELITAVAIGVAAFTTLGVGLIATGFALQGLGVSLAAVSGTIGIVAKGAGFLLMPLKMMSTVAGIGFGALKSGLGAVLPILNGVGGALVGTVRGVLSFATLATGAINAAFGAIMALGPIIAAALPTAGLILLGAAVVGLAGYFLYTSGIAGRVFSAIGGMASSIAGRVMGAFRALGDRLKAVWASIQADVGVAFGGVRDSIMAGNWALAGQIIWTTLKLEFQRGLQGFWDPLVVAFYNVKATLLNVWSDTMAGMQNLWSNAKLYLGSWDGLNAGITKFVNWLTNTWQAAMTYLEDSLTDFLVSGDIERRMAELRSKMQGEGKSDAEINAEIAKQSDYLRKGQQDYTQKTRQDRDARRRGEYDAAQKTADNALKNAQPEVYAAAEKAQQQIEADRQKRQADTNADRDKAVAGIDPTRQAAIDEMAKNLAELKDQAAKERAVEDAKRNSIRDPNTQRRIEDESATIAKRTFDTAGTFNKSALFGLAGGGDAAERTAKATETTAKTLKEIARDKNQGTKLKA